MREDLACGSLAAEKREEKRERRLWPHEEREREREKRGEGREERGKRKNIV